MVNEQPRLSEKPNEADITDRISKSDFAKLLTEIRKENLLFVRHYEDTRFKFSQITIALSAALAGTWRLLGIEGHSSVVAASTITVLGLAGAFVTLKYSDLSDRHAAISRAFRKLLSSVAGDPGHGTIEVTYSESASIHARRNSITRLMGAIRVRYFWLVLHGSVIILGLAMLFTELDLPG